MNERRPFGRAMKCITYQREGHSKSNSVGRDLEGSEGTAQAQDVTNLCVSPTHCGGLTVVVAGLSIGVLSRLRRSPPPPPCPSEMKPLSQTASVALACPLRGESCQFLASLFNLPFSPKLQHIFSFLNKNEFPSRFIYIFLLSRKIVAPAALPFSGFYF